MACNRLHIGQEVRRVMQEQGRSTAWLAREIGCARPVVYRIYERPSIDTLHLCQISRALHFDFFKLYSDNLKADEV